MKAMAKKMDIDISLLQESRRKRAKINEWIMGKKDDPFDAEIEKRVGWF